MSSSEPTSDAIVLAREAPARIGPLTIEPATRRVVHDDGREAFLEPRVMQALVALLRAEGRVVSRDDLMAQCWSGVVVGEDALNRVIGRLRRLSETLGADVVWLETITKVGYRLVRTEPRAPQAAPHREPGARAPGNLPRSLTALLGRQVELQQICGQLRSADLVTITGAGGVGKTRLAHEVGQALADNFGDGVWLAELAPVTDPALVPGALARALGLDLPAGDAAAVALADLVKARDCLIILDNCEHLIDAAAALAAAILERSSTIKLLATSQERLGVDGERVTSLKPLAEADAAQLFRDRARAADARFDASERTAIAAICRRLDGMPLAIEMAAARAPAFGCEDLLGRLDHRLRLLTGGRRTALPRHRTVVATLDWSHDLLSERDAAVFRRLGVFSGGFAMDAAAAVCACETWDSREVAAAVASLVAKSLAAPEAAFGGVRYRVLETTRAYALEKLAAAHETEATQRAHAHYFRRLAAECFEDFWLRPVSDDALAERYFGEVDNCARAIDWAFRPEGDAQVGIALAANAMGLMFARSLFAEFAAWADQAAGRLNSQTPPAVRARLLASQARMHAIAASPAAAAEMAIAAIEACRAGGDAVSLFMALDARAVGLTNSGRVDEARPARDEVRTLMGQFPSPSRALANVKARLWRDAFTDAPQSEAASVEQLDAAIAELQSFGADRMVVFYRRWRLSRYGPADVDREIDGWRALLANMGANFEAVRIAGRLMTFLARRSDSGDLDEAMQLGRRYAHLDVWVEGAFTLAGLGWVALKTGRPALAGRLAGQLGKITSDYGDTSHERKVFNELSAALRAELAEDELCQLMSDGANLSAEAARRLVLGDL